MSRKLERNGTRVLPGLWQLKNKNWVVRAQRVCLRTRRKINRRRLVRNATRAEALAVLETLRCELDALVLATADPSPPPTSQQTLADFATSWLRMKTQRNDLAKSTQTRYAGALDHLSSWLQQMPVSDITRTDVQQWMVASKRKFAARTINGWLRVLRACLAEAVADGLIAVNPATQVKPLKEEVDLEDTNSLSAGELSRLLLALSLEDGTIHAIATTQAFTGLRWGEATALRWEDYDEAKRILRIRRAVSDGEIRSVTKTGKARIVGVPEVLVEILSKHRTRLVEEEHPGLSSTLMFPSNKGTPLSSGRISDSLKVACKKAGIKKRFTSHGFRRSLTDLLRSARVDPVVAAGLTGHETERMRRHYSTVRDEEAVDVSNRVAQLVRLSSESTEELTKESTVPTKENGQQHPEVQLADTAALS